MTVFDDGAAEAGGEGEIDGSSREMFGFGETGEVGVVSEKYWEIE